MPDTAVCGARLLLQEGELLVGARHGDRASNKMCRALRMPGMAKCGARLQLQEGELLVRARQARRVLHLHLGLPAPLRIRAHGLQRPRTPGSVMHCQLQHSIAHLAVTLTARLSFQDMWCTCSEVLRVALVTPRHAVVGRVTSACACSHAMGTDMQKHIRCHVTSRSERCFERCDQRCTPTHNACENTGGMICAGAPRGSMLCLAGLFLHVRVHAQWVTKCRNTSGATFPAGHSATFGRCGRGHH